MRTRLIRLLQGLVWLPNTIVVAMKATNQSSQEASVWFSVCEVSLIGRKMPWQKDLHCNWKLNSPHIESNTWACWSWWDPTHQEHRGFTAEDMPSQAVGLYKSCTPPSPMSFVDPWLILRLSQRKAIFFTAWMFFQGIADLLHAQQLPRLLLGYSQKPWTTPNLLSPFCVQCTYVVAKRKQKQKVYSFFPSFGNTDKLFLLLSAFQTKWQIQMNDSQSEEYRRKWCGHYLAFLYI